MHTRLVGARIFLERIKNILKNPSSQAAFRQDEYAIKMSKGVTGSVLVFVSNNYIQCAITYPLEMQ